MLTVKNLKEGLFSNNFFICSSIPLFLFFATVVATVVVTVIATGITTAAATITSSNANDSLSFKRCSVKVGVREVDAQCGTLRRLEDPDNPAGRVLDLAVVKFPSNSLNPEPDAFTVIQGGPGGSSIDLATTYLPVLDFIRDSRDVLVVDQRGTGRSDKLACEAPTDEVNQFNIELVKQESQKCLSQLDKDSDLRFYTTSIAVDDLEAMRIAAGYPQLNLWGVSYGTRVAQHYLRKYPASARSVILDGVVPVGMNLAGSEIARRWNDSFNNLNQRCATNEACQSKHGDLKSTYQALQKRFSEEAISVNFPHPKTGIDTEYTFTEFSLFSALRLMTYSTDQLSLIPLLLSETLQGNYTFVAAQITIIEESFSENLAVGMHNSVACTEDAPFVTDEDIARAEGTLIGRIMSDVILASCSVWPKGTIDNDFLEPFSSDVPVLVLSGETDPVTPPENGDLSAKMLGNTKHIIVPAHGHGVLGRGCMPKLASLFIESASFESIDETCVKREKAMPIFSTLTGPKS